MQRGITLLAGVLLLLSPVRIMAQDVVADDSDLVDRDVPEFGASVTDELTDDEMDPARDEAYVSDDDAADLDSSNEPSDDIWNTDANDFAFASDETATEDDNSVYPKEGAIEQKGGVFRFAKQQGPVSPVQPVQPLQPVQPILPAQPTSATFGSLESITAALNNSSAMTPPSSGAREGITSGQASTLGSTDLGSALAKSTNIGTVGVQQRSPVSLDPHIRGFKGGQIYSQADGAYFVPARQDLDTMLSKIDPGAIQTLNIIPGPFSSLYGPGFSFIDIVTFPTPRYNGPEAHFTTAGSYLNNGRQWYGRETVFGGSRNYGYRIGYGHRTGSDYRSGDSTYIPASYNNRDVVAQFGFDINPDQHLEMSYRRLDQTNTEYPAQFFDIRTLVTDAFNMRLIDENPSGPWERLSLQGWYNRTRFNGDTLNQSKQFPRFDVISRVDRALRAAPINGINYPTATLSGFTTGDVFSTGSRGAVTFGSLDAVNMTMGADIRYLNQNITENFRVANVPIGRDAFDTNLPRSHLVNPGVFTEMGLPLSSYFNTKIGSRSDWVHTDAFSFRQGGIMSGLQRDPGDHLSQNDQLYSLYMTNVADLNSVWSASFNAGHAQRPPTLIDRYADGVFLGILQNGFSRVIGAPGLKKERNWQLDAGISANYSNYRLSLRAYHAWIVDYITYTVNRVSDPTGAQLLTAFNTPTATLSGFEFRNEYDLDNRWITPFATMNYVHGNDITIHRPLPGIPPFQSRVGLRFHDRNGGNTWGMEMSARMVDAQDRLGFLRLTPNTVTNLQVVESRTGGFTTAHLRAYWNVTQNLNLITGIDNVFDRNYLEHLNLRFAGANGFGPTSVLNPGFSPYFSMVWNY